MWLRIFCLPVIKLSIYLNSISALYWHPQLVEPTLIRLYCWQPCIRSFYSFLAVTVYHHFKNVNILFFYPGHISPVFMPLGKQMIDFLWYPPLQFCKDQFSSIIPFMIIMVEVCHERFPPPRQGESGIILDLRITMNIRCL